MAWPNRARRGAVITELGVTQILAWGSTYYLPAVLAKPIAADTGWPLTWVIGGLSLALLVAGVVSPTVGRTIQARGGRVVLAVGAAILAIGLAGIAVSTSIAMYLACWGVLGLGMAAGLYDAAFSTLGGIYGAEARPAITALTLFGGFASTLCWPFSAVLLAGLGWRRACLVYAGLHLALALPGHILVLSAPRAGPKAPVEHDEPSPAETRARSEYRLTRAQAAPFAILAGSITLGSVITSVIAVHLLSLLEARGITLASAVGYGALIGPSQVGARVYELAIGRRFHPTWTLIVAASLLLGGLVILASGRGITGAGLILYGSGVGIMTIARGTLPLALFGSEGYAVLLGRLALPSLIAQAIAPIAAAVPAEHGAAGGIVEALAALALLNLALAVALRLSGLRNALIQRGDGQS